LSAARSDSSPLVGRTSSPAPKCGQVAPAGQAGHELRAHRVSGVDHDDRERPGAPSRARGWRSFRRKDQVHRSALSSAASLRWRCGFSPASEFRWRVLSFDPAQSRNACEDCPGRSGPGGAVRNGTSNPILKTLPAAVRAARALEQACARDEATANDVRRSMRFIVHLGFVPGAG
jgi:hypothetical protein